MFENFAVGGWKSDGFGRYEQTERKSFSAEEGGEKGRCFRMPAVARGRLEKPDKMFGCCCYRDPHKTSQNPPVVLRPRFTRRLLFGADLLGAAACLH